MTVEIESVGIWGGKKKRWCQDESLSLAECLQAECLLGLEEGGREYEGGGEGSPTSCTAANMRTCQAQRRCKRKTNERPVCVTVENEWMSKNREANKAGGRKTKRCRVLKSLPSAACPIRPEVAALPLLFSLIDGAALLLTFPQEHFTCSVLIGPRPPCSGSESGSWCPDIAGPRGPKKQKKTENKNKAKPQNKTKKLVLVERCAKACQACFHNIQRKELFFFSLFLNRQENAKRFGRLSWTHAANSEEKRSRPAITKHLRIIRHTRNLTAAPSNFCSASLGQILSSHNMSNRMSCLTMGRHSCLISLMYWPSVCLKEILLYEPRTHLTDCTFVSIWFPVDQNTIKTFV